MGHRVKRVARGWLAFLAVTMSAMGAEGVHTVGVLSAYFEHVLPLVIVGEGWSQQIVITCVDRSRPCAGFLTFWGSSGEAWDIDLVGQSRAPLYPYVLQLGQTVVFETVVKQHPQILGWARASGSLEGLGDFLMQSVWRKQAPDRPDLMTSAIASLPSFFPARTSVFFDSRGGKFAGVMILFSDICRFFCNDLEPATFRGRAYDTDGNLLAERQYRLKMGEMHWFCLECDIPEVVGRVGVFVVDELESSTSTGTPMLSTFSLQFAPNGAFTAITGFEH